MRHDPCHVANYFIKRNLWRKPSARISARLSAISLRKLFCKITCKIIRNSLAPVSRWAYTDAIFGEVGM